MIVLGRVVRHCPRVLCRPGVQQTLPRTLSNKSGDSGDESSEDFDPRRRVFPDEAKRSPFIKRVDEQREDHWNRLKKALKTEIDGYTGKRKGEIIPHETDILIIGGGIVGSSVAYWFKRRAPNSYNITIVDKDPTYQFCATTRSAGGVRQQFSIAENCQMAMFGAEFIRDYKYYLDEDAPDPQFNPEGYLFIADTDEKAALMERNARIQRDCGARVELMSPDTMKNRFPFIKNADVKLASYGLQNEGWCDPHSLLQGLKQYNLRRQTGYIHAEVVDFRFRAVHDISVAEEVYEPTNHAIIRFPDGEIREITFAILVIAAGPQTGDIGRLLRLGTREGVRSVPIPVEPRKRAIYTFHAPDAPVVGFPFLINPDGTYCRREGLGGHYICGRSPDRDDDERFEGDMKNGDLDNTDDAYFNEKIWPTLADRVPAFNNIKPGRSWAGLYDYNYLDENAIIGWHPYYHHVIICSGFSGHGLQMGPAAGRSIMEMIVDGEFVTIDMGKFSFNRILHGEPIEEQHIV